MTRTHAKLAALLLALCAGSAGAQQLSLRGVTLTPVDPGIADADPLAVSLRVLRADYRLSTNFERVYEAKLDPKVFGAHLGAQADQTFFVRFAGGVAAVFPKSEYVRFQGGKLAAVPPGTVFSVGGPIEQLMGAPNYDSVHRADAPRSAQFVDLSARMPAVDAGPDRGVPSRAAPAKARREVHTAPAPARSIFEDEAYRCARLDALVNKALDDRR